MKKKLYLVLYNIVYCVFLFALGITIITYVLLCLDAFNPYFSGKDITKSTIVSIVVVLFSVVILLRKSNKKLIFNIFNFFILFLAITLVIFYFLKTTGLLNKFTTIEKFREFISSFGYLAVLIFILFQFLQVVILPIPGVVSVGAGVLLFGPFLSALYSCIGIIIGSLCAFYIGRRFGGKGVSFLIGKYNLEKGLKLLEGKDKYLFTFMFLFPFFPDDLLCFLAGVTKIDHKFFIIMVVLTRIISIYTSAFSLNNNLLPYNTWWGILIWLIIFIVLMIISFTILKGKKDI